jgi:hypothetical protein
MRLMEAAPLTDSMRLALQQLATTGDRALTRYLSQWWLPERTQATWPQVSTGGRVISGWASSDAQVLIPTATVKALMRRKLVKATGGKRRVPHGPANRVDHWRVELTPAGVALCEELAATK